MIAETICNKLQTNDLTATIIDCDIDSLDVLEMLFELEEAYDIDIPRNIDEQLRGGMTVQELIAIVEGLRTT